MKIYIGSDHNGFEYKNLLIDFLVRSNHEVIDTGDAKLDPVDDFPQFAEKAALSLLADPDKSSRAILLCGSGQGMAMAANRFRGIRASLCWNLQEAHAARNDDDSNVLCLGASMLSEHKAEAIITAWLATPFAGAPRYIRRIKELDKLG